MGSTQSSDTKISSPQTSSTPTLAEYKAKADELLAKARENNSARKELLMARKELLMARKELFIAPLVAPLDVPLEHAYAYNNFTQRFKVTAYSREEPHADGRDLSSHTTLESAISFIDYENETDNRSRIIIPPSLPSSSLAQSGVDVMTSSSYAHGFRFVIHDTERNTFFEWCSEGHVVPISG